MKERKKVSVLYSPGTNCEEETMAAIRLAGGDPRLVFLLDLYKGIERITDCDLFVIPGGFSFGDHIETGVAVAVMLEEQLHRLKETGVPILGICNGNQILVRAGLFGAGVAMVQNRSKTFCSRPIRHRVVVSNCVWTKDLEGRVLTFPAAHGYGRYSFSKGVFPNVAMVYEGISPNGGQVAMITDDSGQIAAIMDHPERPPDSSDGQAIFRCGLAAV